VTALCGRWNLGLGSVGGGGLAGASLRLGESVMAGGRVGALLLRGGEKAS
jgi:hypothetical protein